VIVKSSEVTPHAAALLAKMTKETFPEDPVAVANGGLDLSKRSLQLKIDHLLHTGNSAVGKMLRARCPKFL
jgi:coniferyl-aldehyde dehydrogenase